MYLSHKHEMVIVLITRNTLIILYHSNDMYFNHLVWLPNVFHILSTRFSTKHTKIKFSLLFIRQKIFLYDIDMNDDGSGWHSKSYSNTTNRLTTERPRAIFVIGFLWYRWCWLCTLFICGAGIYSPKFPLTLWYPCVIVYARIDVHQNYIKQSPYCINF